MTDLMDRLITARPTEAELDAMWAPDERVERLRAVLATAARRRWARRAALPVTAASLAAAVVVPPLLDSSSATAAADLHVLARSAVRYDAPVLQPGQWLHERSTSVQRNARGYQGGATYVHDRETWTSYDGRTYLIDHERGDPAEHDTFDDHPTPSYQDPTPAFAATLPDTADGLLAYLGPKVSGSSSHDAAMYSALTELASSHTLPPATLAAAFDALATIPHVTTSDVEVGGRPAIAISYDDQLTADTDAYVFDRATGQELSSHNHSDLSDYESTTTLSEVVDRVPVDVVADSPAS